jgi:crossover junction endodeoxyribonuclease RuvC
MFIIGLDPGLSGGIAVLNTENGKLTVRDMPVFKGTKTKTELDMHSLADLLEVPLNTKAFGVLERVQAMPKQGVTSMFRFGYCYGALRMALAARKIPYINPTPQVWKKHFNLKADKAQSRALASQRFPDAAQAFSRVKDDGRAEAALLALYGQETQPWLNAT